MTGPTAQDAILQDNQQLIGELSTSTDATIKSSADSWSKGIAALFVVVGAGAWIAGPDLIVGIDAPWRWIVLGLVLLGLIAQLFALGYLLFASAGTPTKLNLANFSASNRVRMYLTKQRALNAKRIEYGRRWGLWGLVPFILAFAIVILTAPNTAKLVVETADGPTCGVVESADNQEIVLSVAGKAERVTIDLDEIANLKPVASCG